MDYYTPKLSHAVGLLLLGLSIMLAGSYMADGLPFAIMEGGGVIVCVFSFVVMNWVDGSSKKEMYKTATSFAEKLAALDPDQYNALGIRFPTLRISFRGRPVVLVEDSDFQLKHFRLFLEDSNYRQVVAERDWNSRERPRYVHQKIVRWLELHEYVHKDSAAGSHSHLWRGASCQFLINRYVFPTVQIARVSDEDFSMSPGAYSGPLVTESGRMQEQEVSAD